VIAARFRFRPTLWWQRRGSIDEGPPPCHQGGAGWDGRAKASLLLQTPQATALCGLRGVCAMFGLRTTNCRNLRAVGIRLTTIDREISCQSRNFGLWNGRGA